jgi:hypothetical protein
MSLPPFGRPPGPGDRPARHLGLGAVSAGGCPWSAAALDGLLAEQQVVACRPVVAEILAGARGVQRSELRTFVHYRWDGTGGQRLAAQKISSSGYGGSGATAPYATLKLLPPSPGADGTDTTTEFWTITIAGSTVSDPTTLIPVMVVGVYSASGYWFPVDESVGASTIHSAELPGPVYVCVVLKLEPVVSSVRVIDQSDSLTWAMSIVTPSPALRG